MMQQHGKLLQKPGAFAALRTLMQVACDMLYTSKYSELIGDGEEGKASGRCEFA